MKRVDYDARQYAPLRTGPSRRRGDGAEETAVGFAALDAAVAAETTPQPIDGHSDLLVPG